MIKKLLGIAPQSDNDGAFIPSKLALKLATSPTTSYSPIDYSRTDDKKFKVLILCTEQSHLKMKNGKIFATGNHPVEMLVPMLHFENAGFEIEVFTPNGKPVEIEMWAMPSEDEHVDGIYLNYKDKFRRPENLSNYIADEVSGLDEYGAIFIPGGHGALLGLPENDKVRKLLNWGMENDKFILSICHGPAVFLSLKPHNNSEKFPFEGYKIAAFPDSVDKQSPLIGYMPGHLSWQFGKELQKLGVKIVNKKADKTCVQDRKVITGASPDAANAFGILATQKILESLS